MQIEALTIPTIVADMTVKPVCLSFATHSFLAKQEYICNEPPKETKSKEIQLLLGNGIYGQIMQPATGCKALEKGQSLVAYQTPFGVILSSAGSEENKGTHFTCHVHTAEAIPELSDVDKNLDEQLKASWDIETLGIKMKPDYLLTAEKDKLTDELIKTAHLNKEGRLMIGLPFRKEPQTIHHNFKQALGRLCSTATRLTKEQKQKYLSTWRELLDAGYLKKAPEKPSGKVVTHLSHFAVIKESSLTTKIRPVLDAAAATSSGKCLNDLLWTGPQPGDPLLEILIRFRVGKLAFVCDIAKAFYAVGIHEEDRDAVRVILPKDGNKPITKENAQVWRYQRLVMGATCSSWILMALIGETLCQKKEDKDYNEISDQWLDKIRASFHADNCVLAVDDKEKGNKLAQNLQIALDRQKFHLREYCASSPKILKGIQDKDIDQLEIIKVLIGRRLGLLG